MHSSSQGRSTLVVIISPYPAAFVDPIWRFQGDSHKPATACLKKLRKERSCAGSVERVDVFSFGPGVIRRWRNDTSRPTPNIGDGSSIL